MRQYTLDQLDIRVLLVKLGQAAHQPLVHQRRQQGERETASDMPVVLYAHGAIDVIEPATHGFVCLNVLMKTRPTAGLDLQPRILGARAAELVIAQLQRNETGIPEWPSTTTIPAKWIDGPTLRATAV